MGLYIDFELTEADIKRFRSKVKVRRPDECWPWIGTLEDGYGRMSVGRQMVLSHRIAFFLTNGFIDSDLLVRHRCDNPPCCNGAHLLQGVQADNVKDRESRGRRIAPKGSAHGRSLLDEESVKIIRRVYVPGYGNIARLARQYDVAHSTMYNVVHGITWKEVSLC